jgi:hypothetical protein
MRNDAPKEQEELSLSKATQLLLEECRMVLPGIQTLFGFQLVAVFNARFPEILTPAEQRLHLLAIGLVAVSVALIMAPAAYHRQTGPHTVTEGLLRVCSRLVLWSMPPLAVSLCIEFYLISRVIVGGVLASVMAAVLLAGFFLLWFVLPRMQKVRRVVGKTRNRRREPGGVP